MVARIVCLALALGAVVGCYNLPQPECGFACGPSGACPSDYSCNTAVNRCELNGSSPSCTPARIDAGMDVAPDSNDVTPPMVLPGSLVPAEGASSVALDTVITVSFSEDVLNVNDSNFSLEANGATLLATVTYESVSMTATLEPDSPLLPDMTYTIRVLSGITDHAGNALAMPIVSMFSTGIDMTAPFVNARLPAFGATGVGVGTAIYAQFNEDVTGVSSSSFTVTDGGVPVPGIVSYASATRRAVFTPTTQLAANTTFTLDLTSAIRDAASNALVPVTWTFTTGADLQAPAVLTRSPVPSATAVSVTTTVTASFDEQVTNVSTTSFTLTPQGGSPVAATVTYTAGTRTARLTPDLQLAPNTQHTAALTTAITDSSSIALAATSWSFTTGADTIGPRLVQTTPEDLATAVPTSATIAVQFDEPVQNVTTTTFTVGGVTGTIALSAGNTIATFTPDAPLPAGATILVTLTAAITDAAANAIAPLTFSFMTAP